jgi:hypothetical protein
MNKIIKVYGHHRSGNNYLCALLYKNFYEGIVDVGTDIDTDRRFILFGEEQKGKFHHPYAQLFGSHDPRAVTQDSIYIIRSWKDVEPSLAKLKHRPPRQWANNIETHINHIYTALQKRPYVVYYEDLVEDPSKVLRTIEIHFEGCNAMYYWNRYITDVGYCGWPD